MTTSHSNVFVMGQGINMSHAEHFVDSLGQMTSPLDRIDVDLSKCRHVDIGVGWRIGNAISRFTDVHVRVPTPRDFTGTWFLSFTRTGLGLALANAASTISTDDGDVTDQVKSYYASQPKVIVGQNYVALRDLHRGLSFDVNDESRFRQRLENEWLPRVNVDADAVSEQSRSQLAQLLLEAVQNVFDHAGQIPFPRGSLPQLSSYFALAYRREIKNPKDLSGDFNRYLRNVNRAWGGITSRQFVEFIVCDTGVGIAARQSQLGDIYWSDANQELLAFRDALTVARSIKLKTKDSPIRGDPGFGFQLMATALREVRGYASLRTGRFLATFDGTDPTLDGFGVSELGLGYLPGTVLHVVAPLPSLQLEFPLSQA